MLGEEDALASRGEVRRRGRRRRIGSQSGSAGERTTSPGSRAAGATSDRESPPPDPESAAKSIVLRQLTLGPRTRAQLAATLDRRGVPEAAASTVLDRFTDLGLIDDEAFAEAWVESRHAGRGLARRALAQELRVRGVDGEVVDAAVDGLTADQEAETARRLVRRSLAATRGRDWQTRARRATGQLARKGYGAALAYRVVREELDAEGERQAAKSLAAVEPEDDPTAE